MNIPMNKTLPFALALAFAALCFPVLAGEGHDHDPAPTAAAPALFDRGGVAKDKQLTIYLDRFADNAPVKGATLDLDVGGAKVALKEIADGEFQGAIAQPLKPGLTPVTATVTAGSDIDLLAAEFDMHADAPSAHVHSWKEYLGRALAAGAALLALAWIARRVIAARRAGGAA